jgi:hypothetical protein
MPGRNSILLSGGRRRGYGGRSRAATGRPDAAVGYPGAWLGRVSAGGHGSAAAELTPLRLGVFESRRSAAIQVLPLLLLFVVGVAVWRGAAAEHPGVSGAARPGAARPGASLHRGLSSLPLAAQGAVSTALGSDSRGYRLSRSGHAYQAVNPTQRLRARFDGAGVHVQSGGVRLGLRLDAMGYGASLSALAPVSPRALDNRVVYARGGLSEWYANGPLGLEQGFTLGRAPAGDVRESLTLSLALSGDVRGSVERDGRGLMLAASRNPPLRYDNLLATDARGRVLHSWITLQRGQVLLHVDARGARYPLKIDPLIQQGGKLTGKEEVGKGYLGYSVALSADGNTALIGGPLNNGSVGAAWVFTRSEGKWTQQGEKLTGGAGNFGNSAALASEGNTALVGGLSYNGAVGAAWVFTRSAGKWTQQAKLTGEEETGEGEFGTSVALASEGNTALIGGESDNKYVGAAWVFTRSEGKWAQQGKKLTGKEEIGEGAFGSAVALSSQGYTALIGGHGDNEVLGAAWAFASGPTATTGAAR